MRSAFVPAANVFPLRVGSGRGRNDTLSHFWRCLSWIIATAMSESRPRCGELIVPVARLTLERSRARRPHRYQGKLLRPQLAPFDAIPALPTTEKFDRRCQINKSGGNGRTGWG